MTASRRRRPPAGAVLATLLAAGTLAAQAPAPGSGGPGTATPREASATPPESLQVDAVVGVVGDRVILQTELDQEYLALTSGRNVSPADRERLYEKILLGIAQEEIWVQVGKSTGRQDPIAFEEQVDARLDAYIEEQRQEVGSYLELERQLRATGRSVRAVRDQQRKRMLRDYARSYSLSRRFQDRHHLLVTPSEMHRYYREHATDFDAVDRVDLLAVAFDASGDGRVAERAAAAAEAWRADPERTAADIATAFGGRVVPPITGMSPTESDEYRREIRDFAATAAVGAVSPPIDLGSVQQVYRVAARDSQPARAFDDPVLQQAIQERLTRQRLQVAEHQIMEWKLRELTVMPRALRRLLEQRIVD